MSRGFIITATGTDIGKTWVTAILCRQLRAAGQHALAIKPVQCGWDENAVEETDPAILLQALGKEVSTEACADVSGWRLKAPMSPDMAARREGTRLAAKDIAQYCRRTVSQTPGLVLSEGVGGLMVPLNEEETSLDWFAQLGWPVILVTGSYLGTLSHTLTALECLRARALTVAGVVISTSERSPVPPEETAERIALAAGALTIVLPRLRSLEAWRDCPDLTGLVLPITAKRAAHA